MGLTDADVTRLRRLADRDDIRQLAHRYAWALDSRDIDAVARLFVPLENADGTTGAERWAARFQRSMSGVGVTILLVGNHVIDFDDDDHAHGVVYCRGYIEPLDGRPPRRLIEQLILYRDRYLRVDGEWRFVDRVHELWFGIETAERPLQQPPANWPEHHDGLGTVPYGEPTWQSFWAEHGGYGS